jgi:hypothetical protein
MMARLTEAKELATINTDDVEWLMQWPDREDEVAFDEGQALAALLANEVAFINAPWWEKDWPTRARESISVAVVCNDTFAYACADAEHLPYDQIQPLYQLWRKDSVFGPVIWCMIQRKQKALPQIMDRIKQGGLWDIGELPVGENTLAEKVAGWFIRRAALKEGTP